MSGENRNRRQLLQFSGLVLAGGFAGCAEITGPGESATTDEPESDDTTGTESNASSSDENETDGDGEFDIQPASGSLRDVPIPDDPDSYEYAMMGTGQAPVTATFYGGWKCTYTRDYVLNAFPELVAELVVPGEVDIEFRAIAYRDGEPFHGDDEPRAARAGLAVWNTDPRSYWSFFEHMFANHGLARTDRLMAVAEQADVEERDRIREMIETEEFAAQVRQTMDRAKEVPITAIPRMIVNDEVAVPSAAPEATRELLEDAIDQAESE